MRVHHDLTAQELLFKAHQHGITITADGKGSLRAAPARLLTPRRIADIKRHKTDLLPLVAALEHHGGLNDPIILQALALFNATLKDCETLARMPHGASTIGCSASEQTPARSILPERTQATFSFSNTE